jgi:hypothetical protein
VISQWSAGQRWGSNFRARQEYSRRRAASGSTRRSRVHHRDDEQAARPDHGRRSAGLFAAQGPEIAAWSKIAPTVNLDALVAAAGYEKVVAPDLAKLHKPGGKWISLPLQIYSTNMLFLSKRAMDKAKADKIPVTWADFNDLAEKMKASGSLSRSPTAAPAPMTGRNSRPRSPASVPLHTAQPS